MYLGLKKREYKKPNQKEARREDLGSSQDRGDGELVPYVVTRGAFVHRYTDPAERRALKNNVDVNVQLMYSM